MGAQTRPQLQQARFETAAGYTGRPQPSLPDAYPHLAAAPQAAGGYMPPASPGSPQPASPYQAQPAMFAGGAAGMAAVPIMAAGGGMPMGMTPMGSGGAPGMTGMGGGGWVMVAPPAAFMQSMQQWAGTAPGYMVYQHQQQAQVGGSAGGSARASRLSNNSSGPLSPVPSGSLSPRGSGGSMARVASGGLPHFPSRMESALGGVYSSSRQASLDHAAAAALEAAQRGMLHSTRSGNGRPRNGSSDGASGAAVREASPSARSGHELLHQLHAAAAAAEGGASAAAAAARERREEHVNDQQGAATAAAAEEEAAAVARGGRGGAPPQPQARGGSASGSASASGTASASLLSPARSGDLNNIEYISSGTGKLGGSASNSSSLPELAGKQGGVGRVQQQQWQRVQGPELAGKQGGLGGWLAERSDRVCGNSGVSALAALLVELQQLCVLLPSPV